MTRFSVVDTGIGIKAEDREKLFPAFEQVEPSATRRFEGTGLGLYISQKLAELIDAQDQRSRASTARAARSRSSCARGS